MDLFKRISETVREFFDKLQPSQRFSLIALSAALVVSLFWMVAWSTSSDQVPLLPGAPEEAKVEIIKQLDDCESPVPASGYEFLVECVMLNNARQQIYSVGPRSEFTRNFK